jgi:hypothetical protein
MAGVDLRSWFGETLWPGFLPGLVAAPVWLALQRIVQPHSWLGVALCGLAGSAVFLCCLFGLALRDADRQDIGALVKRVRLRRMSLGRLRRGEAADT